MVQVLLERRHDGAFSACTAEGHAGFSASGNDIVCAAVTILLRTVMQVVSDIPGISAHGDTSQRGRLAFRAEVQDSLTEQNCGRLICAADFLHKGISALANEYPEHVSLVVRNNE